VNFKEIIELIDKVAEKGLAALEIEQAGLKLRIEGRRCESAGPGQVAAGGSSHPAEHARPASPPVSEQAPAGAEPESLDPSWHVITSPIVGTFYRSSNPESDVFVTEGDRVAKGKVLCIIEAMKLMNEIESDFDGTVMKIFPQNGQPVEYGENLFALKP